MASGPTDRVAMPSLRADGTPDQQDGWELIGTKRDAAVDRPLAPAIETATIPVTERAVGMRQRAAKRA